MSENKETKIQKRIPVDKTSSAEICHRIERLCSEIDPYSPLSEEVIAELKLLGVENFENPFSLTNHLLQLLDKYQADVKKLQ